VSIIDQTGDQWDHHRDNRRGDGVGLAIPRPPKATARVTLGQMRERAGVLLGDLAARAGVSVCTLRKFETGVPDLAPATYAHTIAALEALKARSAR
jgi:DNA-binding XRE family transcriptional regulator